MNSNIIDKHINKSIEKIIDEYIKKICDYDKLNKTFDDKLNNINLLTNNLIDYCIKKKIFYFIENKISYTSILTNFKSCLKKFIKDLVDPNDEIINKYIINVDDDNISMGKMGWDNISDINTVMFKNFKNLNETFEKNVSFGSNIDITNYDDGYDGFQLNNNFDNNKNIDLNNKNFDDKILPIYIKLLINQNKYLVEFTDKLMNMCDILSNQNIKYKKNNPYD